MTPIDIKLKYALSIVTSDKVEGWCTPEKAEAMASLIIDEKPKLCVELGVFGGRSLLAQGLALRENGHGVIWGIDPWTQEAALEGTNDPANNGWWKTVNMDSIRDGALGHVSRYNLWDYVKVICAKSRDCAGMFHDIDILHQDSNHSEEVSCDEVMRWVPHVRIGGYVWMDDTDWPTTRKAVSIIEESCSLVKDFGGYRLYQKDHKG